MERKIKRGDIYYANLNPVIGSEQGGTRPVLIISNDVGNKHSPMRADGEISKDEYQAMRSPVDEEIKKLQKALDEIPQEKSNPKGLDIEGIRSTLNSFIDFSGSTISHDVVNQFVYLITPTSDTTFDWYVNLNGTADVKATFTAEGRKKNCIIKLEEIEKISSVHREKNEDNAHFIKNPHIFTYLHRQQSLRRTHK